MVINTRGHGPVAMSTRGTEFDDCRDFLLSYGIASRDDAIRVAALLRNRGNTELASRVLLCYSRVARDKYIYGNEETRY